MSSLVNTIFPRKKAEFPPLGSVDTSQNVRFLAQMFLGKAKYDLASKLSTTNFPNTYKHSALQLHHHLSL